MTAQEALSLLNDIEFDKNYQGVQEYAEMLIVCKEALEKQIPKKPIDAGYYYMCPCCLCDLGASNDDIFIYKCPIPKYCPDCGQALDWSENNG